VRLAHFLAVVMMLCGGPNTFVVAKVRSSRPFDCPASAVSHAPR
jgi:hypothetical protein